MLFLKNKSNDLRVFFKKKNRKAEIGLQKVSEVGTQEPVIKIVNNRVQLSLGKRYLLIEIIILNLKHLVSGLGFGLMSGTFSLVNILADATGPGTVGLKGDSHYFFISSAFTTLAFILLHTFWSIIFFRACDNRNYLLILYVIISHFIASGLVS